MFKADEGTIDFLNSNLSGDQASFFLALRTVVIKTPGLGMTAFSRISGMNRENLYRTLSAEGNPNFDAFRQLVRALGMDISLVSYTPPPKDHSQEHTDKAGYRTKSLFDDEEGDIFGL